jgi:hypothetical protein
MASVAGVVIIVIVLVVAIPVAVLVSGALAAVVLGWLLKTEVDEEYEGSEYLEMGV